MRVLHQHCVNGSYAWHHHSFFQFSTVCLTCLALFFLTIFLILRSSYFFFFHASPVFSTRSSGYRCFRSFTMQSQVSFQIVLNLTGLSPLTPFQEVNSEFLKMSYAICRASTLSTFSAAYRHFPISILNSSMASFSVLRLFRCLLAMCLPRLCPVSAGDWEIYTYTG